ncbi:MAG: OadG family protein [Lachnospiraceae bacterium]|nr:OadG family protein [Lachnospiraceae bacterium]
MLNLISAEAAVKGEMLGTGTAALNAVLGYLVVFTGLLLLMIVVIVVGKIMVGAAKKKTPAPAANEPAVKTAAPAAPKPLAPGSAGDVKLYGTDPHDAAMIMAIVADKLQKPLNELKFVSIKEVPSGADKEV